MATYDLYYHHLDINSKKKLSNHRKKLKQNEHDKSGFLDFIFHGKCGKEPKLEDYKTNPATSHNAEGLWQWDHEDWIACKEGRTEQLKGKLETAKGYAESAQKTVQDVKGILGKEEAGSLSPGGDRVLYQDQNYQLTVEEEDKSKKKKVLMYSLIGLGVVVLIIVLYVMMRKKK